MKRISSVILLVFLISILSAWTVSAGSVSHTSEYETLGDMVMRMHQTYDLKYDNGSQAAGETLNRLVVQAKTAIDPSEFEPAAAACGPDNLYILQFSSKKKTLAAKQKLEKDPRVKYAEEDFYMEMDAVKENTNAAAADDPINEVASWHKDTWGVKLMNVDQYAAFVKKNCKGRTVTVAVIDSGVDRSHPFLSGRMTNSTGHDFIDADNNPYDEAGHGTHVSGTIVDCTPGLKVKILPYRIIDSQNMCLMSVAGIAMKRAANSGAKIINCSFGGGRSQFLVDQIKYASVKKRKIVIVAAGNDNTYVDSHCPANVSYAITVSSINSDIQKASDSNYGSQVLVAAPGVGITSSVPGGGYETWSGTSMATPHVSGAVAMYCLLYPNANYTQVKKWLARNARDIGSSGRDIYYGYGLLKLPIVTKSVTLNRTSATAYVGSSFTLTGSVLPTTAWNKTLKWSSSNSSVASVSGGLVRCRKAGTATITCTTVNNCKATCRVTVYGTNSSWSLSSSQKQGKVYLGGQKKTRKYSKAVNIAAPVQTGKTTITGQKGYLSFTAPKGKRYKFIFSGSAIKGGKNDYVSFYLKKGKKLKEKVLKNKKGISSVYLKKGQTVFLYLSLPEGNGKSSLKLKIR